MSGTLFVVATPIGNLEDITLRALRVLREADLIAAEDTRRTAKLLTHYAIATPSISFHQHNTRTRLPLLMSRLHAGATVALVTDAGTPGVSDPGVELVRAALDGGITVDVAPGPSASLTAAVASGFPLEPLTIYGFAPARGKERKEWLEAVASTPHTVTFFEAPHRILKTLSELGTLLGERPIVLGRELTKAHQEFISGRAKDIVGHIAEPRGEYTVVLGPQTTAAAADNLVSDQDIAREFGEITEQSGSGRRAAVTALARRYGRPSREIYGIIEKLKSSV